MNVCCSNASYSVVLLSPSGLHDLLHRITSLRLNNFCAKAQTAQTIHLLVVVSLCVVPLNKIKYFLVFYYEALHIVLSSGLHHTRQQLSNNHLPLYDSYM